jgi:hypothetical protein
LAAAPEIAIAEANVRSPIAVRAVGYQPVADDPTNFGVSMKLSPPRSRYLRSVEFVSTTFALMI